jgi:hypothetical protein
VEPKRLRVRSFDVSTVRLTRRAGPRVAAGAITAALLLAAPAFGKVWFQSMGGRHLSTGQQVTSVILGCPGNPSCREAVHGARVYLHRLGARAARRGPLIARVSAGGRIAFNVPQVKPGRFRLLARVRTASGWRTLHASDPFRIAPRR